MAVAWRDARLERLPDADLHGELARHRHDGHILLAGLNDGFECIGLVIIYIEAHRQRGFHINDGISYAQIMDKFVFIHGEFHRFSPGLS